MIRVSVMYRNEPGARFDHDYYRDQHLPLVAARLGAGCLYYEIDKGISGVPFGCPAPYIGLCHIFSESIDAFGTAFAQYGAEIDGDIPNYIDLVPVTQISEVVIGRP